MFGAAFDILEQELGLFLVLASSFEVFVVMLSAYIYPYIVSTVLIECNWELYRSHYSPRGFKLRLIVLYFMRIIPRCVYFVEYYISIPLRYINILCLKQHYFSLDENMD